MRPVKDQAPSYPDMLLFLTTRLDRGHCLQSESKIIRVGVQKVPEDRYHAAISDNYC